MLIACGVVGPETATEEADHTEGEPTYAQYGWLWADETEEEFKRIATATSSWYPPEFLPVEGALTQRLQFWLDAMDDALREAHPEAMKGTPKPLVIIRKDSTANAWVSYIPVAWSVPTRLSRAEKKEEGDDTGARELAILKSGRVSKSFAEPLERKHNKTRLKEFVRFHNNGFTACKLKLEEDTVVFGDDCAPTSDLYGERSDRLAFNATGKWITVTTGLLEELLDEDRIVAVLAHELGHYYRAHGGQPSDVLNYFYDLGDGNHAKIPPPDERFLEQTAAVREKLRSDSWFVNWDEENRLMTEQRLGFYTTEQEADDIALELLTKIGMPPGLAIDAMLQLHKQSDDASWSGGRNGEIGWAECSTLRDRGFKDEEGRFVSVPVGDPSNAHHSYCFRIFNMTREILVHDYEVAPSRPRPPGGAWSKLLSTMNDPLPEPEPEGGGEDD